MASDRPSSDIVFSVKPNAQHGDERGEHRDRQRQAGDDGRAPRVEEQEDDETVSTAPSISASWTLSTESSTRAPASRTIRSVTPGGSASGSLDLLARTSSATAVVLKPFDLMMSMPTACSSLKNAAERGSSAPS